LERTEIAFDRVLPIDGRTGRSARTVNPPVQESVVDNQRFLGEAPRTSSPTLPPRWLRIAPLSSFPFSLMR
jgi:hypothetical protein